MVCRRSRRSHPAPGLIPPTASNGWGYLPCYAKHMPRCQSPRQTLHQVAHVFLRHLPPIGLPSACSKLTHAKCCQVKSCWPPCGSRSPDVGTLKCQMKRGVAMIQLSRRAMIKDGLLAVSAGMILPSVFARAVRAAHNAAQDGNTWAQAAQQRTLIVVQMAGGNDGLNTIVPYTDGAYYQARPTLAVKPADVIPLNDRLGMHPALAAFKPLWQAGKLAVVEGVGYPNANLSHFVAMDIWQTLDLNGQGASGWLGKYVSGLVDQDGHPFQSLAVGSSLPTALRALNADVPVVSDPKSYRLLPDPAAPKQTSASDARVQTLLKLYNTYPRSAPYAALLDATAQTAVQGSQTLDNAAAQYTPAVQYPNTSFARGLQVLAEVIAQGLGLRVGYVTIGGFDTHAGQAKTHETLMTDLSEGLAAFYADLQAHNA